LVADGKPADVLTPERIGSVYGVSAFIGEAGGEPLIVPLSHH
jgi:iron complex transport system ATP-binding protein